MATQITVPQMGESISEGILAQWLVAEGAYVKEGDPVFELETDKISTEVPAEVSGTVTFSAAEGDEVEIGAVVGSIDETAAAPAGDDAPAPAAKTEAAAPAPAAEPPAAAPSADAKLSPAAKKLIDEKGLDASQIPASGAKGHVTKGDVLSFIEKGNSAPAATPTTSTTASVAVSAPAETRQRMSGLRQRIASRLVEAQHVAAILTTFNEIDMTNCMNLRKRFKEDFAEKHETGLGFMSFFTKAVVEALKTFPLINSRIEGNEIVTPAGQHVGVAVGTEKGLIVPVLHDCQEKSFADIERDIRGYAKKAREGKITIADMEGGTFTISNGGTYGSLLSTPILNPPQSGILGMHNIQQRPIALNGEVVIRPMMYIALSYDHRIVDGKEAVGFLIRIKELVEDPERLIFGL